jgi:hypothetical protein
MKDPDTSHSSSTHSYTPHTNHNAHTTLSTPCAGHFTSTACTCLTPGQTHLWATCMITQQKQSVTKHQAQKLLLHTLHPPCIDKCRALPCSRMHKQEHISATNQSLKAASNLCTQLSRTQSRQAGRQAVSAHPCHFLNRKGTHPLLQQPQLKQG